MDFEKIVEEEWRRMPERFAKRIDNVALLIEDEPDARTRDEESLHDGQTLLGLYRGIPLIERGESYGAGGIVPDTITLYRLPIMEEAQTLGGTPQPTATAHRSRQLLVRGCDRWPERNAVTP